VCHFNRTQHCTQKQKVCNSLKWWYKDRGCSSQIQKIHKHVHKRNK